MTADADRAESRGDVLVVARPVPDIVAMCRTLAERRIGVSGPVAARQLRELQPNSRMDAAVVDARAAADVPPEVFGTVCRRLAPLTLVITEHDDVDRRLTAVRYGVAHDVVAPFEVREVVERVELMLARRRRARNGRISLGDVVVEPGQRTLTRNGTTVSLTPRELQLLEALMLANGRTLSKHELVDVLWHGERRTPNSVEAHVSALRKKLDRLGVNLVHTVHGEGYAFRAPPPPRLLREDLVAERDRLVSERDAEIARRDALIERSRAGYRRA